MLPKSGLAPNLVAFFNANYETKILDEFNNSCLNLLTILVAWVEGSLYIVHGGNECLIFRDILLVHLL